MAVAAVGLVHRTSRTHQKRLVEVAVAVVAVAAGCCSQIVTHQTSCCPAAGVAVAGVAAVVAVVGGAVVEAGGLAKPDLDGSLQNVGALDLVAAVRLPAVLDCLTGCDCWIETVHVA